MIRTMGLPFVLAVAIATPSVADTTITWEPPAPRPTDEIELTVTYLTNCFVEATAELRDGVIAITAGEGCVCIAALPVPYTFSVTVDPLPVGLYPIELWVVRRDGETECGEPELRAREELAVSASGTFAGFSTRPPSPTDAERVTLVLHSFCPGAFEDPRRRGTLITITQLPVGFGAPCFDEPGYEYEFDLGLLPAATYVVQLLEVTDGVATINLEDSFAVTAADGDELWLHDGRFRAGVGWRDFAGHAGSGKAVALSRESGYFWFFGPSNAEVVLKVLDGRGLNGCFWVFAGTMSNVEFTVTVTDLDTGAVRSYFNPLGEFGNVGDTAAFCPGGK